MVNRIKITGVVDRDDPDPTAPHQDVIRWIGDVSIAWTLDGRIRYARAFMLRVATGGAQAELWGPSMLALRWIGDPPPPDIAQSVYDVVRDRGPDRGAFDTSVESLQASPSQPSYRPIRASSALAG